MTVLVTGAAGFLGRHVVDVLLERGEEVRALVRPGGGAAMPGAADVETYRAEIGNGLPIEEALRGVERVIHCAARTGPWGPADEYRRTNVHGLEELVRGAMAAGVRRVVHVSSITVHGNDVGGTADESSRLREEPNPYSRSKVAGELMLRRMIREDHAPVTIVRPGWIYGPRDNTSFARIARLVERGRMVLVGAGRNHLPLIYVRDVARGVVLAAEADGAEGRSYLLVNDEQVTQREFVTAIATELGADPPRRHVPYRLALGLGAMAEAVGRLARRREPPPLMRYGVQLLGGENRFSIARARDELGFTPLVGFAEGVRHSVDWYRGV